MCVYALLLQKKKKKKIKNEKSYYRETSRNGPIRLTSGKSLAGSVVSTLRRVRQSTAAVVGDQANGAPIPYILNCQYPVTWIHTRQLAFIGPPDLFQLRPTFYVLLFFLFLPNQQSRLRQNILEEEEF